MYAVITSLVQGPVSVLALTLAERMTEVLDLAQRQPVAAVEPFEPLRVYLGRWDSLG